MVAVGHRLANLVAVYVDGVTGDDLTALLDKYVAVDLVQHTPGVGGGRAGLAAALQPLIDRYDRRFVLPLRGFEDGPHAFLQTFQTFGHRAVERVAFDIVETDETDLIVQHWAVSAPLARVNRCGLSQIDGTTCDEQPDRTIDNKVVVAQYLTDVLIGGRKRRADQFVAPDLLDHDPAALPWYGVAGDAGDVQHRAVHILLGAGSFVAAISDATIEGRPATVANLFRLREGRIVEHWTAAHSVPVGSSPVTANAAPNPARRRCPAVPRPPAFTSDAADRGGSRRARHDDVNTSDVRSRDLRDTRLGHPPSSVREHS